LAQQILWDLRFRCCKQALALIDLNECNGDVSPVVEAFGA